MSVRKTRQVAPPTARCAIGSGSTSLWSSTCPTPTRRRSPKCWQVMHCFCARRDCSTTRSSSGFTAWPPRCVRPSGASGSRCCKRTAGTCPSTGKRCTSLASLTCSRSTRCDGRCSAPCFLPATGCSAAAPTPMESPPSLPPSTPTASTRLRARRCFSCPSVCAPSARRRYTNGRPARAATAGAFVVSRSAAHVRTTRGGAGCGSGGDEV
mmetsp:Transcript_19657/g.45196  ORF Transcript_19657/g.45196 Transcript_19657/m.45196 type:complete len:210 (-) Transcript_19657:189-818(-)